MSFSPLRRSTSSGSKSTPSSSSPAAPRRRRIGPALMPSANASARAIQNFHDKFFDVASSGDFQGTRARLDAGQDIDVLHSYLGCPALHGAIDQGQRGIVRLLLDRGAGVDIQNARTGHTSLHLCARRGDPVLMRMLLNAGANRKIEAADGRLPIQLAAEYQWELAMNMLRDVPHKPLVVTPSSTHASIHVEWEPPPDNGTPIDRYELYWKPRRAQSVYATGKDPITKSLYWFHRGTGKTEGALPDEGQQRIGEFDPFGRKNKDPIAEQIDYPLTVGGGGYNPEWHSELKLTVPAWSLEALPPSHEYYVVLRAHSAAGFGEFCRAVRIKTRDMSATEPLNIRLSAATARMISVNWTEPTDDRGGHVQFYELMYRRQLSAEQLANKITEYESKRDAEEDAMEGKSGGAADPYARNNVAAHKIAGAFDDDGTGSDDEGKKHAGEVTENEANPWISISKKIPAPPWDENGRPGVPNGRIDKLRPSTPYVFRARAWNKTGWSRFSAVSEPIFTTSACRIVHTDARTLIVSWDWKDGEEKVLNYEVQIYSLPPAAEWKGDPASLEVCDRLGIRARALQTLDWVTASNEVQEKRYSIRGLLPARCFSCRVRCEFESTGWTDWSESGESAIATTKADEPDRPAPAWFHGIEAHDRLSWQWTAPHDNGAHIDKWEVSYREFVELDEYDVDEEEALEDYMRRHRPQSREKQVRFPWTISHDACTASFHVIEGLHFGTEYEVSVRCHNRCGWSKRSRPSRDTRFTRAVEAPIPPRVIEANDTTAKIVWLPPTLTGMPIDLYEVQYRISRLDHGVLHAGEWMLMTRCSTLVHLATNLVPTVVYEFRTLAHTYASDPQAQWSMPGEASRQVKLKRRL